MLALALPTVAAETTAESRTDATPVGKKIDGFELRDVHGRLYSLEDFQSQKLLVVAFLGTDCPLVKLYSPRLNDLAQEFADKQVGFVAINSNRQDEVTKVAAFARRYDISFPVLKDPNNAVADLFGAVRTPEVFVLDENRVIRYWGRIDDQYGLGNSSGYAKSEMRHSYVAECLTELLAGKEVTTPVAESMGCLIGRIPDVKPHGDVTYSNQIARIMQKRCVECHRDHEIAPFPLLTYDDVVGWGEMICEVVDEGRMPPWFANPEFGTFANDCRLTDEEKELIHTWVANGSPEGDPSQLPEPRQFAEGWRIGEPDAVFYMSDEPYVVQAEGVVDYQYFEVDPGFTEDKWIKAAESRPGNRSVVHHIIAFIVAPGSSGQFGGADGGLSGYAPGMPPNMYRDGVAVRVPAGSKIRFQLHYTPVGTEQSDRSCVGVIFADPQEVRKEIDGGIIGNVSFAIPPGDGDYAVDATKRIRKDTVILSLTPHMHLRGKSFRYVLEEPDGTEEILLDVPRYDFNWQLRYDLVEPRLVRKGSKLHCYATFDNSEENPFNPDPSSEVRFGEQTFEEMMFGFYTAIDPEQDLSKGRLAEKPDPNQASGD